VEEREIRAFSNGVGIATEGACDGWPVIGLIEAYRDREERSYIVRKLNSEVRVEGCSPGYKNLVGKGKREKWCVRTYKL